MNPCPVGQVAALRFDELGDQFRRYRLRVPQAVQTMAQSLRRWGQCAPIVATLREEKPQVLDGFTRWEAAQQVRGMTTLLVRLIEVDDRRAKAAIYGLNQTGRRPYELEEAWLVQALVREDGLSQSEVAELLGRHKSWVCRRLALLEKLGADVRQELEVGLLTPTAAREIARLPAGNQSEVLDVSRREALSGDELGGVVRLLLGAVTAEQKLFVLTKPREALGQVGATGAGGLGPAAQRARQSREQAVGGAAGPAGVGGELPGMSRLDGAGGLRPPGPGPGLRAAGARREVRGGSGRRPGRGDEPAMNNELVSKIVALFHGGASMRRIARSLGVSRRTVHKALGQVEQARGAGPTPRPRPRGARQPARRLRTGDRRPAGALPRHHGPTDPRGIAPARLHGRLHDPLRAGAAAASRSGRRARAAVRDRPGGTGTDGLLHV